MSFAPSRRPLRGLELTGYRRHVRRWLVVAIVVGAALMLVGLGLGSVRVQVVPPGSNEGWGEWRSYALASWFIPIISSLAVLGLAPILWRGRPFTGVALGASAVLAVVLSIIAEPEEVIIAVDGIAEVGYLGLLLLGCAGIAMIGIEPILAIFERRALEASEPGLPVARVVR